MKLRLCLLTLLSIVACGRSVKAQVSSNQPGTVVNSTATGHIIGGGSQQQQNLFHSFSEFDTSNGQFVNFILNCERPALSAL